MHVIHKIVRFLTDSSIFTLTGTPIERVSNNKHLGIWIDDKLYFNNNISELIKKLKSKLSFFYCNRAFFTLNCRKQLVQVTLLPVLDYVDIIYMHAAVSILKPLDAVYYLNFILLMVMSVELITLFLMTKLDGHLHL